MNDKPRILIIGNNGQVGWELQHTMAPLGDVVTVGRNTSSLSIDLAAPDTIRNCINAVRPDWIINAAAYTAVDRAEEEPELAMTVNGVAPGCIAEAARKIGAKLVHYSTDYIFDGKTDTPYTETDKPNPQSVYGKTKLAGERAIQQVGGEYLVFRTSWIYGSRGHNFLQTIKRLAMEREELGVVHDQVGSPTWCRHIAEVSADVVTYQIKSKESAHPIRDIYNLTAEGQASWYEFANAIVDLFGETGDVKVKNIRPITTEEYPLPAPRPAYSVLDNSKLSDAYDVAVPNWIAGLADVMNIEDSRVSVAADNAVLSGNGC